MRHGAAGQSHGRRGKHARHGQYTARNSLASHVSSLLPGSSEALVLVCLLLVILRMDDGGCWSSSRGWMIPSQPAVSQPPLSLRRTASHDAGSTGSPVRARPLQAGAWELSVREKPAGNRVTTSREGEGARAGGRLTGFFSSCLLVVLPLLPSFDDPGACPGRSGSSHPGPNAWRGDRSRDP